MLALGIKGPPRTDPAMRPLTVRGARLTPLLNPLGGLPGCLTAAAAVATLGCEEAGAPAAVALMSGELDIAVLQVPSGGAQRTAAEM